MYRNEKEKTRHLLPWLYVNLLAFHPLQNHRKLPTTTYTVSANFHHIVIGIQSKVEQTKFAKLYSAFRCEPSCEKDRCCR
jgi:hypothetical protein